ncbi:PRTRC system protein E [Dysgonomonas sp. 25]|uniref:PRTRC system protein E n=1 Tax=Dysgonomonas sp. 25 TaxID=2302933 RepID=UPI0013D8C851|nr:PRTRC system protein E [Dysgonomonas sp. 25]NDV69958.1 PRTRC system protein E [Dysgonomonas sp. 25]
MFTEIFQLVADGQSLQLSIMKVGDRLTVATMPVAKGVQDDAKGKIQPLILTGTPQELDARYLTEITSPIKQVSGLLSNLAAFERSAKKAEAESKPEKEKASKADKFIKDAERLEKNNQIPDALALYRKGLAVDKNNEKIKAKINELSSKLSQTSMFSDHLDATEDEGENIEETSVISPVQADKQPQQFSRSNTVPIEPAKEEEDEFELFIKNGQKKEDSNVKEEIKPQTTATSPQNVNANEWAQFQAFMQFQKQQEAVPVQ